MNIFPSFPLKCHCFPFTLIALDLPLLCLGCLGEGHSLHLDSRERVQSLTCEGSVSCQHSGCLYWTTRLLSLPGCSCFYHGCILLSCLAMQVVFFFQYRKLWGWNSEAAHILVHRHSNIVYISVLYQLPFCRDLCPCDHECYGGLCSLLRQDLSCSTFSIYMKKSRLLLLLSGKLNKYWFHWVAGSIPQGF